MSTYDFTKASELENIPMTKLFEEATILAVDEFIQTNRGELDKTVVEHLQLALDTFESRSNSVTQGNPKAEKVLRGQGVTLNTKVL